MEIFAIPAFTDNYIWAVVEKDQFVVVDPGDSLVVKEFAEKNNLQLRAILITHWHPDHTGGIIELVKDKCISVYGPKGGHIDGITDELKEGDSIRIFDNEFSIFETPGHTLDHIAFYSQQTDVLFCGDTLFSAGCGRLFEGTYDQLHDSIQKINELPGQTKIYCGHEYTLSNLEFVKSQISSEIVEQKYLETLDRRANNQITLPSTLETERKINPFLLETVPNDIKDLKEADCFKELRIRKDNF